MLVVITKFVDARLFFSRASPTLIVSSRIPTGLALVLVVVVVVFGVVVL